MLVGHTKGVVVTLVESPVVVAAAVVPVSVSWLTAVSTSHTVLTHVYGVTAVVLLPPPPMTAGHMYMGERTRTDVQPWQLMEVNTVVVVVCVVRRTVQGKGSKAMMVVAQPKGPWPGKTAVVVDVGAGRGVVHRCA